MGQYKSRVWDASTLSSRPQKPQDSDTAHVFSAYVPYPIAAWTPVLSEEVKSLVTETEKTIRNLNLRGDGIHDAAWLLRHAESASSSTIEGVHPSARRLARAEAQLRLFGQEPKPNDQEALCNIFATEKAIEIADRGTDITLDDIRTIHATLMQSESIAGKIRTTQNWIGSGLLNPTPTNAAFVPPPPEYVDSLMNDLVVCMNRIGDNPIVHAAVVHSQFETIHPFADGNGRTGRAVMVMMLRRSGLTSDCTIPISSALALRRSEYIRSLNATHVECSPDSEERSRSMSQWVAALSNASMQAAEHAEVVSVHVESITNRWRQTLANKGGRRDNAAMRLLHYLPNNPVMTEKSVSSLLAVSARTARRALRLLSDTGIIVSRSAGKGTRAYEAHELLDAYVALSSVREGSPSLPTLDNHQPPEPP